MYQINSHILSNVTTERRLNIIIDYLTHGLINLDYIKGRMNEWWKKQWMNEWNQSINGMITVDKFAEVRDSTHILLSY